MIRNMLLAATALVLLPVVGVLPAMAQQRAKPTDLAMMFGEREDVQQISLSPSGTKVAFIAPGPGPSSILYVSDSAGGSAPTVALSADGKPKRLRSCFWVSDSRLVCNIDMIFHSENGVLVDATRTAAVDIDGKNLKALSNDTRPDDAYVSLDGGRVIDELPDESGAVLMERAYVPEERQATHLNDTREGLGVDRLDTNSLAYRQVEPPRRDAVEYISDGRGKIRIMGTQATSDSTGYDKSTITYYYRPADSKGWKQLSVYNLSTREGFNPYAVDPTLNVVYGFERKDGRRALYSIALDGSKKEELVFARPDVDVDGLVRIGRRRRVVGVTYSTDKSHVVYFDKPLAALAASLSKALPGLPLVGFVRFERR